MRTIKFSLFSTQCIDCFDIQIDLPNKPNLWNAQFDGPLVVSDFLKACVPGRQ